jgi:endonuclease-3
LEALAKLSVPNSYLTALRRFYGRRVDTGEPRDPFRLIVWENAAYLVDDARRRLVFERLEEGIGVDPRRLLAAGSLKIERIIREGGMQPQRRAEKLLRCAQIAMERADGDLLAALRGLDRKGARALLKRFPGIGDPGADKVLLLAGLSGSPALDSNGLRVLERIGNLAASPSYAASYRAGIAYLTARGIKGVRVARRAFELLRQHGRTLCKRTRPRCAECPLRNECPYPKGVRLRFKKK